MCLGKLSRDLAFLQDSRLTDAQVEKKMFRYDRIDSPTMPTPALSSTAQSPQSSSHPSTNNSTVDEPVHSALANGKYSAANATGGVSIEDTVL